MKFLDTLDTVVKWFCITVAGLMTLTVLLQVVSRYLPVRTPPWTEELARYLMIYMAFIGASHGIRHWNNISVDYFLLKLPDKPRKIAIGIMQILVLGFMIYIGVLGLKVFPKVGKRQLSATMGFPMLVPQYAIIIGSFLISLQLLGVLLKPLTKKEESDV